MGLTLELGVKQKQSLCQNQIQALKILEMTSAELEELLFREYQENPLLEYDETGRGSRRAAKESSNDAEERLENIAAGDENAWRREFLEQLDSHKYSKMEWMILRYLTETVDEDGIYRNSLEDIADALRYPLEGVERCLNDLAGLEPFGVFSVSEEEFLLKQIRQRGTRDALLETIITDYLAEVAEGKIVTLAKKLKTPVIEINSKVDLIKSLKPRPLMGEGNDKSQKLIPDLIAKRGEDGWEVSLNDDWIEDYSVSDYYLKLMKGTEDPELLGYFAQKKERCQNLMNSISQRRKTLLAIGEAIVERQEDFFLKNTVKAPMTMTELAELLEVNVSTISRAIRGKTMQAGKQRAFEIKKLFSSPVSGLVPKMDADAVKAKIAALINKEDPAKPYNDGKIAELLKQEDIAIARRTVAKYREAMSIPKVSERKTSPSGKLN